MWCMSSSRAPLPLLAALTALALGCAQARSTGTAGDGTAGDATHSERGVQDGPGTDGPGLDRDTSGASPGDVRVDTCGAECAGKCKGADDGCGRPCPVNQCCPGRVREGPTL